MSDAIQQDIQTETTGSTTDVGIQPMNFSSLDSLPEASKLPVPKTPIGVKNAISSLYDVPFTLVFEVGRIDISLRELMRLKKGKVIDLRHISVDSIDIRINNIVLGFGEIIGLQQTFGVRFRELELMSQLKKSGNNNPKVND